MLRCLGSVISVEFPPRTVRGAARSVAGPDPKAADQYLRYSDCFHYLTVHGVHRESGGTRHGTWSRVCIHGGYADPYQVEDAAADGSGAGKDLARRRSA